MEGAISIPEELSQSQFENAVGPNYSNALWKKLHDKDKKTIHREVFMELVKNATDVFLTHDWGIDELNRPNHNRVSRINKALKERGITTWFDDDRMEGYIADKMTEGIDNTACVVVFITDRYIEKVSGRGPNKQKDNCLFEFRWACKNKGPDKLIPVVMEPRARNTSDWYGLVASTLSDTLFIDYTADENFDEVVGLIYDAIIRSIKTPIQKRYVPIDEVLNAEPKDEFEQVLRQRGAQKGHITCSLRWFNSDDLDLHCVTPNGSHIYFGNKSADGGRLDVDMNALTHGATFDSSKPVENIFFSTPQVGRYRFYVKNHKKRASNSTQYKVRLQRGATVEDKDFSSIANGAEVEAFEFDWSGVEARDSRGKHPISCMPELKQFLNQQAKPTFSHEMGQILITLREWFMGAIQILILKFKYFFTGIPIILGVGIISAAFCVFVLVYSGKMDSNSVEEMDCNSVEEMNSNSVVSIVEEMNSNSFYAFVSVLCFFFFFFFGFALFLVTINK